MIDRRFSKPGQPATEFERELLAKAQALEDPWLEIAHIIGLDATLALMDRFARCLLSCPSREAFVGRLHRVWLDMETLRLRRARKSPAAIATELGIEKRSIRRRTSRALRRDQPKRG